jgi:AcrR family transcriptional regulator
MNTVETAAATDARPGRPRAELDDDIAEATLAVLARDGYERLTMGAVAEAAGIGKPTLYRRHGSKSALVAAVLVRAGRAGRAGRAPSLPDDTRAALVVLLSSTAAALAAPGALTVMGSLLAQAGRDPDLTAAFREAVFRPQHAVVHATLQAGQVSGDVRADLDVEAVDAMLFGALLARATLGEEPTEVWANRVVAAAWPAIASHGQDA